jgi:hypothetical protein
VPSAAYQGPGKRKTCGRKTAGQRAKCLVEKRAPGRIRTCGTRFRRAVLYPLSYGGGLP